MNIDSVVPILHPDLFQFYITVGLPGVGKTTFCKKMERLCPPEHFQIVSRDKIRCELLKDYKVEKNLDKMVSERVVYEITNIVRHTPARVIMVDGCYTLYSSLKWLLLRIQRLMNTYIIQRWARYEINLCIIGSPSSPCCHPLTDRKIGDYTDYKGSAHSVPKPVYENKKRQFEQLIQKDFFHDVAQCCDHVFIISSWSK